MCQYTCSLIPRPPKALIVACFSHIMAKACLQLYSPLYVRSEETHPQGIVYMFMSLLWAQNTTVTEVGKGARLHGSSRSTCTCQASETASLSDYTILQVNALANWLICKCICSHNGTNRKQERMSHRKVYISSGAYEQPKTAFGSSCAPDIIDISSGLC